ncbi:hypothetical protein KUCAC02_010849 [Chaenocephalus aceratus]|uniref:Uncharacterized protein n=1 Tax=Chaenocephalus aceratus TaxID=36190 RepID=A0ACB9WVK7_CHAAC|nr:hypothetical protein KUCAC02_010849 [Chaenocephalus aceratus]
MCLFIASGVFPGSEGKNWDDYILVCQDGDLAAGEGGGGRGGGCSRTHPSNQAGARPDEGSTHSKDSDFTIVNPNDL